MIKRVLALVIVLAFSIESFAAVVGDNDGAAFITKAEFDSLKSTFQAQIDKYNSSIDNKIDGAISQYLDGIKLSQDPDVYLDRIKGSFNTDPFFLNYIEHNGVEHPESSLSFDSNIGYTVSAPAPVEYETRVYSFTVTGMGTDAYFWIDGNSTSSYNSASGKATATLERNVAKIAVLSVPKDQISKLRFGYSDIGNAGSNITADSACPADGASFSTTMKMLCHFCYTGSGTVTLKIGGKTISYTGTGSGGSAKVSYSADNKNPFVKSVSSLPAWDFDVLADGSRVLRKYNDDTHLNIFGQFKYKVNKTATTTPSAHAYDDSNQRTYTLLVDPQFGDQRFGSSIPDDQVGEFYEGLITLSKVAVASNSYIDYRTAQFGHVGNSTTLYCYNILDTKIQVTNDDYNNDVSVSNFEGLMGGFAQSLGGLALNMKKLELSPEAIDLYDFVNSDLSSLAGEKVRLGGGIPLIRVPTVNSDSKYKLSFEVLLTTDEHTPVSGDVRLMLSEGQFYHCDFESANKKIVDATISCDANGVGTLSINDIGLIAGKLYFVNAYGLDNDKRIVVLKDAICKAQ